MPSDDTPRADTIITDARILTLDAADSEHRGIAIAGERILAVGDDADIAALTGPGTRRLDGRGRRLVPGLIDGHAHMDREGLKEALPSLAGCTCIDDILDRIRALAAETPPGEWIVTMPVG